VIVINFVLPGPDGFETPSGRTLRFSCDDATPIAGLFEFMRQQLGTNEVRLSLEAPQGQTSALMAIDPSDSRTVGAAGLARAKILVGRSGV
jgi:hypothetical protein